jgi:regulator of cell morphogenesis and NO signaling
MSQFHVNEFFTHDHNELDDHFLKFQQNKRTNYPLAKEHFKMFKFGLQRHIVWEEDFLFPLFEKVTGIIGGPTQVMRQEHRQIEAALEGVHKRVQRADPNSDAEEKVLLGVLKTHNDKEENVLYPAIDQAATKEELDALRIKMANLPPERYRTCCNHHVQF